MKEVYKVIFFTESKLNMSLHNEGALYAVSNYFNTEQEAREFILERAKEGPAVTHNIFYKIERFFTPE